VVAQPGDGLDRRAAHVDFDDVGDFEQWGETVLPVVIVHRQGVAGIFEFHQGAEDHWRRVDRFQNLNDTVTGVEGKPELLFNEIGREVDEQLFVHGNPASRQRHAIGDHPGRGDIAIRKLGRGCRFGIPIQQFIAADVHLRIENRLPSHKKRIAVCG